MKQSENMLASIIVPIYNSEKTLRRCVDSAIAQTVTEIEIILIDDGSTDSSSAICDEYKKADKRVVCIHNENQGIFRTRNLGLQIAKGKYIYFLDSDDYVDSCLLERMISENVDLVISEYEKVFFDASGTSKQHMTIKFLDDKVRLSYDDVMQLDSQLLHPLWNKLFRRDVIEEHQISFPCISMWEDACFVLKYIAYAKTFVAVHEDLYHYSVVNDVESLSKRKFFTDYYRMYFSLYNEYRNAIALTKNDSIKDDLVRRNVVRLICNSCADLMYNVTGYESWSLRKAYIKNVLTKLDGCKIEQCRIPLKDIKAWDAKAFWLCLRYVPAQLLPSILRTVSFIFRTGKKALRRLRGLKQ